MFAKLKEDVSTLWNHWKGAALVYFFAGMFVMFVLAGVGLG